MAVYTVRPLQGSTKNIFRIQVSAATLAFLNLKSGDLCSITGHDAIIWLASESIKDNVVQLSRPLQDLYGLHLGDKVEIARVGGRTPEEVTSVSVRSVDDELSEVERSHWEFNLGYVVPTEHEYMVQGQIISVKLGAIATNFVVEDPRTLSKVTESTKFSITTTSEKGQLTSPDPRRQAVGGLLDQISQLRWLIYFIKNRAPTGQLPVFCQPSQGILLYGAKGTGKTLLINNVVASSKTWRSVHRVDGNTAVKVGQEPALYIIDNLEKIAGRDMSTSTKMAHIQRLFEDIKHRQCLVIAETRHPNNIHECLRSPLYFSEEIEVPIPTRDDRLSILQTLRGPSYNFPNDSWLREAADKTHGYVGGDLLAFLRTANQSAIIRTTSSSNQPNGSITAATTPHLNGFSSPPPHDLPDGPRSATPLQSLPDDMSTALSATGPSALNEVFLDRPNVHWTDIGGQSHLKRQLIEAVTWPLKHADLMAHFNVRATKGILLYGPPGCSKTMLVKALATESGLNFLAVKGAELIDKYVGESERAIREVFRKARAARPSIIFFDEIDSLASSGPGTSEGSTTNSGLNVITTLLNEIDGFEELKGVLVVAATNRPYLLDPALMRPGRLDKKIYVGPPDDDTRRAILTNWIAKSTVDDGVWRGLDGLVETTAGYSGAEIVGICNMAGDVAIRRVMKQGDHQIQTRREIVAGEGIADVEVEADAEADLPRCIYLADLEDALRETPKGIKEKTLREFEAFRTG